MQNSELLSRTSINPYKSKWTVYMLVRSWKKLFWEYAKFSLSLLGLLEGTVFKFQIASDVKLLFFWRSKSFDIV